MTKRNTRSTSNVQAIKNGSLNYFEPLSTPSTSNVANLFASFLGNVPSHLRAMPGVRAMVLELAEATQQAERMARVLEAEGEIITNSRGDLKAHPASSIRHQANLRAAMLISRLGLAPQLDKRELQRAAVFENNIRGGVPLQPPGQAAEGDAPDWAAMVKGS